MKYFDGGSILLHLSFRMWHERLWIFTYVILYKICIRAFVREVWSIVNLWYKIKMKYFFIPYLGLRTKGLQLFLKYLIFLDIFVCWIFNSNIFDMLHQLINAKMHYTSVCYKYGLYHSFIKNSKIYKYLNPMINSNTCYIFDKNTQRLEI